MPEFVRANGRMQHVSFRAGDGVRPVVFANSLGTDFRIWDGVVARLPSETPVLNMDKSGHGLSEAGAASIGDLADDLAAVMDHFGLHDALVCGVSVGGMISQALAASRPDLVFGLVLSNTGHRIGTFESWSERIALIDAGGLEPMADAILERWFSPVFRNGQPDLVTGYRQMLTRTPVAGYRTVCAAIRGADLTTTTSALSCPTLCIAGSEDLATPPAVVEGLAALIPNADLVGLEGVGHLPCIEVPERVAAMIVERLS